MYRSDQDEASFNHIRIDINIISQCNEFDVHKHSSIQGNYIQKEFGKNRDILSKINYKNAKIPKRKSFPQKMMKTLQNAENSNQNSDERLVTNVSDQKAAARSASGSWQLTLNSNEERRSITGFVRSTSTEFS